MRHRHARHFLQAGGAWAEQIREREGPEARRWLMAEREDLLSVYHLAVERRPPSAGDAGRALEAALVLAALYLIEGPYDECAALLSKALAAAPAAPRSNDDTIDSHGGCP